MRTSGFLACLLLIAVLAAPLALADGAERARADKARADHAPDADDAADDARSNRTESRRERAHPWGDANATANQTARVEAFIAEVRAMHAAWGENATKVRDACKAQQIDKENATKEQRGAFAHCIRDGYAEWRAEHRASLKALREEMHALFGGWHKGHAQH